MSVNKWLLITVAVLLVSGLVGRMLRLKTDLAAQTTRAERAEEKVTALEAAALFRETQLFALQGQAAQCEEARSREAANAAERRAITGPAREEQRQAQGGIASPRILEGGTAHESAPSSAHDAARRAVADRLNRPL